MNFVDDDDDEP